MKILSIICCLIWIGHLIGMLFGYIPDRLTVGIAFFISAIFFIRMALESEAN